VCRVTLAADGTSGAPDTPSSSLTKKRLGRIRKKVHSLSDGRLNKIESRAPGINLDRFFLSAHKIYIIKAHSPTKSKYINKFDSWKSRNYKWKTRNWNILHDKLHLLGQNLLEIQTMRKFSF